MNVTQRKYTLSRLTALTSMKISALIEENDVLVKANNDNYKITMEEAVLCIEQDPSLVSLKKSTLLAIIANLIFCLKRILPLPPSPSILNQVISSLTLFRVSSRSMIRRLISTR